MKTLDWIVILLFGHSPWVDRLQYAYQAKTNTTMCTWAVIKTIGYFLRNKSEVFVCTMDMSQVFHLLKHSILFRKLIDAKMSPIFIWLIIFVYKYQSANVRWSGSYSNLFMMRNRVRQGAVLSALFYCIYVNGIFSRLDKPGLLQLIRIFG